MHLPNQRVNLYFRSKKFSFILLAATALLFSRTLLFIIKDPEGPNLLIVAGLATVFYLLAYAAYTLDIFKAAGVWRLLAAVCIQLIFVSGLYFFMR